MPSGPDSLSLRFQRIRFQVLHKPNRDRLILRKALPKPIEKSKPLPLLHFRIKDDVVLDDRRTATVPGAIPVRRGRAGLQVG